MMYNNQFGNQWSHYGCYENQYLNNFQFGYQQQSMSYQSCQSYCYNKQYNYCYVQGGNQCYCGSSSWYQQYGSYGNFQDSQCSSGYKVYQWNNNYSNQWNNQMSFSGYSGNSKYSGFYGKW